MTQRSRKVRRGVAGERRVRARAVGRAPQLLAPSGVWDLDPLGCELTVSLRHLLLHRIRGVVDGSLTLHGRTNPVTLRVFPEGLSLGTDGRTRLHAVASAEVAREDFGLTWNQVTERGGLLLGHTLSAELRVEAVRRAGQDG